MSTSLPFRSERVEFPASEVGVTLKDDGKDQHHEPPRKSTYLGVPAIFKLDLACMNLYQAFCVGGKLGGIYLVGSVLERPTFRDIDVVCILCDEDFEQLFPDVHHVAGNTAHFELDPRWLIMSVTISDWLTAQVGIGKPVDFKFQPMTFANARHKGNRDPLGLRTVARRELARKESSDDDD